MKTIDRDAAKLIQSEVIDALKTIAARHGLDVGAIGISYTETDAKIRGTFRITDPETKGAELARLAPLFGIPADHLGRTFRNGGHTYKVVSIEPRRPAYPITAEREDGKRFRFPVDTVVQGLAAAARS